MILANGADFNPEKPRNLQHLKEMVSKFSVYAQVDDQGCVTVENGVGSAQYLSKSGAELAWLQMNSDTVERTGYLTRYYIKYDDSERVNEKSR